VPRLYNEGQSHYLQTAVRRLGSISEIGDSQRGHKTVNTEVERSAALEAITRQRLVKIQQTEKI
jgi:hypothetical protein